MAAAAMGAGAAAASCPCCSSSLSTSAASSSSSSASASCASSACWYQSSPRPSGFPFPLRWSPFLGRDGRIGRRSSRESTPKWISEAAAAAPRAMGGGGTGAGKESRSGEKGARSVQRRVMPNSSLAELNAQLGDGQEEGVEEGADVESITEWEMDLCSRPILDARGKKLWELVVCDSDRQLRFARFYPNNVINSGTLRDALVYIIETLRVPKPQKIRFFRSQMQTIIGKACAELDIQSVPSRRCIQLVRWLDERFQTVYRQHPGYQEGAGPLMLLEEPLPAEVPDTLRGEEWAFVQLPFSALLEEIAAVEKGDNFGSIFDLETLGLNLPSDAMIPGVAVASRRAVPLAAWTNALELASIDIELMRSCLILSSGVSERWRYAYWRRGEQGDQEAQAWEKAKRRVGGLHFLAIQQSLESELCAGFWLLMNLPKSPV